MFYFFAEMQREVASVSHSDPAETTLKLQNCTTKLAAQKKKYK
jgi:hypothetical protein